MHPSRLASAFALLVVLACSRGAEPRDEPRATRATTNAELLEVLDLALASESAPEGLPAESWSRVRLLYGDSAAAAPLWLNENGRVAGRARVLVAAIDEAPVHALRSQEWPVSNAVMALDEARGRGASDESRVRAELALSALYVAFASDMVIGRTDPRDLDVAWFIDPGRVELDSVLAVAAASDELSSSLRALAPDEAGYRALVDAHALYRDIAADGGWPRLPEGGVISPGDTGSFVAVLRERLAAEGFISPREARDNDATFDETLVAAVMDFQRRHGLAEDSLVGPETRAALDHTAERRAAQIAANLERYRWMPFRLGDRYVMVNVPEFRLQAFDHGEQALDMRVVVGSELAESRTPAFADSMSYLEFAPYWNVPKSIAESEILPQLLDDPGYLERNDYEIVTSWNDDAEVIPVSELSIDDILPDSFEYFVRQKPGPLNALGQVKFMFPNQFSIYLHDTSAHELFDERVRAYSHGCVRVQYPDRLAAWVLQDDPEWPAERIAEAMESGEQLRVDLKQKVPVYLLYLTAFDRDGELQFRNDLYDRDAELIAALGGERALDESVEELRELRRAVGLAGPSRN